MSAIESAGRVLHRRGRGSAVQRGHRLVPAPAGAVVEAWGPDLVSCAEEAAAGLVSVYAGPAHADVVGRHRARLVAAAPEALLLGVVEETMFALGGPGGVPVRVEVVPVAGGYDVTVLLADPDTVAHAGPVPTAVPRSGLQVRSGRDGTSCRFAVDA